MYMKAVKTNGHSGYSIQGQRQAYPPIWPIIACPHYTCQELEGIETSSEIQFRSRKDKSNRTMLETNTISCKSDNLIEKMLVYIVVK